jgi:hypothetical protein
MNDKNITFENIIDQFLEEFPEFRQKAEEERDQWYPDPDEKPLQYAFFGIVLNPYLMEEGLVKMDNPQLLRKLFLFMEKMALSTDERINGLLGVEILEGIGDDKKLLQRARKLMGKKTLEISLAVEKSLGRE